MIAMGGEEGRDPWANDPAVDAENVGHEGHPAFGAAHEPAPDRLSLGEEERLPWLDSADDVEYEKQDSGRMAGFVMLGVLSLAALIGGIYWVSHGQSPSAQADGSLIEASKAPYKVEPTNPGGKTFEGTGDASYKVSEGKKPDGSAPVTAAKDAAADKAADAKDEGAKPAAAAPAKPAPAKAAEAAGGNAGGGGVGVQVGAFSTRASAEAAWSKLVGQYSALSGHNHRVVEGQADIGTVYRLQALAPDAGAASALCKTLQGSGLHCQVKN